LIRQLLTESLVLALLGGLGGLLVATWVVSSVLAIKPPTPPGDMGLPTFALDFKVDPRVFGFTLLLSVIASLAFGLAPAIQASKADLISALKTETAGNRSGRRRFSLRNFLVVSQVAMSILLLISAGLFTRSWLHSASLHPGFDTDHVLMLSLATDQAGLNINKPPGFDQQLVDQVAALPGVQAASLVDPVPLWFGGKFAYFTIEGRDSSSAEPIGHSHVSAGYFNTMHIPFVTGRDLDNVDTMSAGKVAIVNQTMANRYWPGANPLGKRIINKEATIEVVGVVRDVKQRTLGEAPQPWMYIPISQNTTSNQIRPTLLVRTVDTPSKIAGAIQREVKTLDPTWPIFDFKTLSDSVSIQAFVPRIVATFLGGIGLFGLLLAAAGVYGLVAYSVSQRTQEIGIRLALGARASDVLSLVIRQGLALILVGLAIGGVAAFLLTRFLAVFLNGISPVDIVTFVSVSLLMVAAGLLACWIPARRATKVDPMIALRYE
jgi:putative ABC transport system permease protein